jgi:hypothetical protein
MSLLGIGASSVRAKAYFLAPTGSDGGAGTMGNPWAGLNKANSTLAAGDTLLMRGGTYSKASGINWTKSGSNGKPIVLAAYPGEHPVFDGGGADWLILISGKYLVIDGLEAADYVSWAIQNTTGSGYVTLRNCRLRRILGKDNAAIVNRECDHIVIENSVIEESGRSPDQTAFDHAIYNTEGSRDVTIRNNLFRDNYGGPAINHYHEPSPYNILIYNNVFVMTKGAERSGIYAGNLSHDIQVYNNTFYLDGSGAAKCYAITLNSGAGTHVVKNNIFYTVGWDAQDALEGQGGNAVDRNLYYPAKDADDGGASSLTGDPLFKAVGSDFHLAGGSPALAAGAAVPLFEGDFDGVKRPAGAWDIGAYQASDGTAVIAPGRSPRGAAAQGISIRKGPMDRYRIEWRPLHAGERAPELGLYAPDGALIGRLRSAGTGYEWENRNRIRGPLFLRSAGADADWNGMLPIP